jgi:phage repressor protein C with HTH and peptisase S24 domain
MLPSLRPGTIVLAVPFTGVVSVGLVVICTQNNREIIKRVTNIKKGAVFLTGDNPGASTDSRHFGWVEGDKVTAKVVWPRINHASP